MGIRLKIQFSEHTKQLIEKKKKNQTDHRRSIMVCIRVYILFFREVSELQNSWRKRGRASWYDDNTRPKPPGRMKSPIMYSDYCSGEIILSPGNNRQRRWVVNFRFGGSETMSACAEKSVCSRKTQKAAVRKRSGESGVRVAAASVSKRASRSPGGTGEGLKTGSNEIFVSIVFVGTKGRNEK